MFAIYINNFQPFTKICIGLPLIIIFFVDIIIIIITASTFWQGDLSFYQQVVVKSIIVDIRYLDNLNWEIC